MKTSHHIRLSLSVALALAACDPGSGSDAGVDASAADTSELDGGAFDAEADDAGTPEDVSEAADGGEPDAACDCPLPDVCFVLAVCEPPTTCTYVGAEEGAPCEGGTCSDGRCIPDISPTCGDGVRDRTPAREGCDDGNESTMDACADCVPQVFEVSGTAADGLDFPPGSRPGVAVDGDGRALFVWTAALTTGMGSEIRARAYAANGQVSTPDALLIAPGLGVGVDPHPTVTGLATGGWVIAWEDRGIDMSDLGIAYRIVRADLSLAGIQRANETRLLRQHQPALAPTSMGFLAAWTDDSEISSGGASRIVVRHFPIGSRASAEVVVSDFADASEPALTLDGAGRGLVAFTDRGSAPTFARTARVRLLSVAGLTPAASSAPWPLDEATSDSHSPQVAVAASGFVAAWVARGRDASGDVRAATVGDTGTVSLAVDTGVPVPADEVAELEPSIALLPDGIGFVVAYTTGREDTGAIIQVVGTPAPEVATLLTALAEETVGDVSVATGPDGVWVSFSRAGLSPVEGPIRAVYGFLLAGD